jgi:hypothetical protein
MKGFYWLWLSMLLLPIIAVVATEDAISDD